MPMDTKFGRMMTYPMWPLTLKSHDCIIMWSCKITWLAKIIIYSLTQSLWLSVVPKFYNVVLQGDIKYFSCCIATTTRSIFTKRDKVVSSCKKRQPIKSSNLLNMCLMSSQDKLKTFYPQYHNTHGVATKVGRVVTCNE